MPAYTGEDGKQYIDVPVPKGKGTVKLCIDDLPPAMFAAIVEAGAKDLVNKGGGMAKLTKETVSDDAQRSTQAIAIAEANVKALTDGSYKLGRKASAVKVSGAVMTEAMRIARNIVKAELKRHGMKVSHYAASEITVAAKAYLETDEGKGTIKEAEATVAKVQGAKIAIDVTAIKVNPDKVAKATAAAEKKKAESKAEGLSAAQAGKVKPKAKGQTPPPKAKPVPVVQGTAH